MKTKLSQCVQQFFSCSLTLFVFFLMPASHCYSQDVNFSQLDVSNPAQQEQVKQWLEKKTGNGFLENRGQMIDMKGNPVPFVLFKAEISGLNLFITETGVTLQTAKSRKELIPEDQLSKRQQEEAKRTGKPKKRKFFDWERIDVELKGASIKKENIIKENPKQQGHANYFYPHCPDGIYEVKEYEKITIKNVYPGIDWVWYSHPEKGYKYDFIVNPGADYRQIELLYKSKTPVKINEQGELELYTQHGSIKENTPVSFYEGEEVATKFRLISQEPVSINDDKGYETSISFDLGTFNVQHSTLTIDPQIFWSTFYGGNSSDGPMNIETDGNGNLFVTGYDWSQNFPVQNAGTFFQGTNIGISSAFILKFDNLGNRLWSTYYGGTTVEVGLSIAIDSSENVFIAGYSLSSDLPVQNSGTYFQGMNAGNADAFILKFDNSGNRLWATYYGGTDEDYGFSLAIDSSENVFLTGYTGSTDFPVQNTGTFFQGTNAGGLDAFIVKFDNSGTLLWSTYYGGAVDDFGLSIAKDSSGNVFVTGHTFSTDFPVQNASTFFQGANAGSSDAFIIKFDNPGNRLWATYYGGSADDYGFSSTVDVNGNLVVAGATVSTNFPVQNAGTFFQGANGDSTDVFILKFDNPGNRLWATYFGGTGDEYLPSGIGGFTTFDNLETDNCGNVYLSFETSSISFPHLQNSCDAGYIDSTFNGGTHDIVLSLFDNSGTLLWSTYWGGDGPDYRAPLAIDNNGQLFLSGEWTGVTNSSSYPLTDPGGGVYYDPVYNGSHDGFVVKFCLNSCICSSYSGCSFLAANTTATNILCNGQCTGTATVNPSGGTSPYTYSWNTVPVQTTQTASGLCAGTYTVVVIDAMSDTTTATTTVTQSGALAATATATATTITPGQTVTLTAGGGGMYQWSPSTGLSCTTCASPDATPPETTTYCVIVTDSNNCTDSACVKINIEIPCGDIFVPNAFSPNNDNANDIECAMINPECIKEIIFVIYDRWGEKVFETSNPDFCWDGTYKGKPMNTAVFVYYLEATLIDGSEISKKGNISLIR